MNRSSETIICSDSEQLFQDAATLFLKICQQSVVENGHFTVVLSGGSTPRGLYQKLAELNFTNQIDWSKVYFFWGDERFVSPDDPESNYRMASLSLISHIDVPFENVYPMPTDYDNPAEAAAIYENELKDFAPLDSNNMPRFNLVLLGIGGDGHTASLFPKSAALEERKRWVVNSQSSAGVRERLTMTFPVINNAEVVMFLVSGANKADILKTILYGDLLPQDYPSQSVNPVDGKLFWMVDQAAYSMINE